MGANSVTNFIEDSQRSGCTNALAQAAPSLALALKRQKAEKNRWPLLTIPIVLYTFTCRSNRQHRRNHSAVHTPSRISTGHR